MCGCWLPVCSSRCAAEAGRARGSIACDVCGLWACRTCDDEFKLQTACEVCGRLDGGLGFGYSMHRQRCSRCVKEIGLMRLARCQDCMRRVCTTCLHDPSEIVVGCQCRQIVCAVCLGVHDCARSEGDTMSVDYDEYEIEVL